MKTTATDQSFRKDQHAEQMKRFDYEMRELRGKRPNNSKFRAIGNLANAFAVNTAAITDVFHRAIVLIEYAICAHDRDRLLRFINAKLDEIEKEIRKEPR